MSLKSCKRLLVGKQQKVSYRHILDALYSEKYNISDVLYSYVCGLMSTITRYFVIFIDDYSIKVLAYTLKIKGNVYEVMLL